MTMGSWNGRLNPGDTVNFKIGGDVPGIFDMQWTGMPAIPDRPTTVNEYGVVFTQIQAVENRIMLLERRINELSTRLDKALSFLEATAQQRQAAFDAVKEIEKASNRLETEAARQGEKEACEKKRIYQAITKTGY